MVSAQKQTDFFHSDYDSIKCVRSIWIYMANEEEGDSIEEIILDRKAVFGNRQNPYKSDLMKGIIISVRSGKKIRASRSTLISMLEKLLFQASADEKKRILTEEYGMIMTTELEGRIRTMCNLSENIKAMSIEKGIEKERLNAIERMIKAGLTKRQIISCGYTKEEFAETESLLCANA